MIAPARGRGALLLAGAAVAMLAGLWGGLSRLGLTVPGAGTSADTHGMLMALGFLGTMIAVERAVALGRVWGWAAPATSAAATVALLVTGGAVGPRALLALAGVLLVGVYGALHRVQPSLHNTAMAVGAGCWAVAAALWAAGWDIAQLVPWLAGFLVVTIAAERLELSRLVGATPRARRLLAAAMGLLVAGALLSLARPDDGVRVGGAALVALAAWLAARDAARRTVRGRGVTRFIALGLLTGYAWLAAAGVLWLVGGAQDDTPMYDAQLHALFLGFVMSMVFAHAPVIAPAVLRRPMRFAPRFYVHLGLLHASLLLRLLGGDAAGSTTAWQAGGVLNEVALLLFVGSTVLAIVQSRHAAAPRRPVRVPAPVVVGLAIGALLAGLGVTVADSGTGSGAHHRADTAAAAAADVTTARVRLVDMRIVPAHLAVPRGSHLVLDVTNAGSMRHDLRLASGTHTRLLAPGDAQRLDAGVVDHAVDGWCTVPGHRQAGMTMRIDVGVAVHHDDTPVGEPDAVSPDLHATPPAGWRAHDATLPPVGAGHEHRVVWHIRDVEVPVAPGVVQRMWTFGGTVPGPALHGRIGDTFAVTVVNDTTMAHNIDFHAEEGPPAQTMRPVAPGQQVTYRFTATHAGAWLYHCATAPMLVHVGNGMYGAVVVDPPGLAPADREYVLVGSELFFGPQRGTGDARKMAADTPDAVVFNGYPDGYAHAPLGARAGRLVRVWVVDAGPSRWLAFHVVGAHFTTAYLDGAYRLRPGAGGAGQVLGVAPGGGGFVELTFPAPGRYPFLSHALADAARGATGAFAVTAG